MTDIKTYRKVYNALIEKKSEIVIDKDNNIIMSFNDYVKFCRNRLNFYYKYVK